MALPKLFDRIFWHNNTTPAINEDNLNSMSKAIDDIDDRVIDLASAVIDDATQISKAEEAALKSEGYAVGTQDGTPVTQGSPYFNNNSEYWANVANPPISVTKDFASIISIDDAIPKAARDVKLKVTPVQDLHGYTKPWVGGAGKNKLPLRLSDFKSINTTGSWSNNVYTLNNVTYTVKTDSSGNVTEIVANNTANANGSFYLCNSFALDGEYIMSVQQAIPANVYFSLRGAATKDVSSTQTSATFSASGTCNSYIFVSNGVAFSNYSIKPMIRLSSVADGSFEPYTNICPITGWTVANVRVSEYNLIPNGTNTSNGYVASNYLTSTGGTTSNSNFYVSEYFRIAPNQKYTWSTTNLAGAPSIAFYDASKQFISGINMNYEDSQTFTTPANAYFCRSSQGIESSAVKFQLELGETATEYKPYTGTLYTIDLGGTRYGGVLDVTSGVLTVLGGIADMGDLSWSYLSGQAFYANAPVDAITPVASGDMGAICTCYERGDYTSGGGLAEYSFAVCDKNWSSSKTILVNDPRYSDASDFTTAVTGQKILYMLATPTTVQLTPTEIMLLQGDNVLSGDTGDIYLEYDASMIERIANAKLDIDTFKSVVAASSDFANFKTRVAAL